jgi:CubicO group peptidase (beta-lactamase class C family)
MLTPRDAETPQSSICQQPDRRPDNSRTRPFPIWPHVVDRTGERLLIPAQVRPPEPSAFTVVDEAKHLCRGGNNVRDRVVPLWLLSLFMLASLNISVASAADSAVEQRIDRIVDAIPPAVVVEGQPVGMTSLSRLMAALHVPGVSVAVIHNGQLEWARGFGVTKSGGPPVTPDTLFEAASISKPVTALAVLQLVQAGRLGLDTDVNQYLKTWRIPSNRFTARAKVTLRELLSHTGGMSVDGFVGYDVGTPLPTIVQTLDGLPPSNNLPVRVEVTPDTAFRYSGGGYTVIRQLLEDVTGKPFAELMQESVLKPLGMVHSTFEQPLPPDRQPGAATPHNREGEALRHGARIYPELAPDGLWSTASDIARYAIGVQHSLAGRHGAILSPGMAQLMLKPRLNHWGLGPIIGDNARHPYFTFSGGIFGFPCFFFAFNRGDGVVVMTNGENGYPLAIELVRSIAHEYGWRDFQTVVKRAISVDPKSLDSYAGAYRISDEDIAVVTHVGNQLFYGSTSHAKERMFPISSRRFLLKSAYPRTHAPREDYLELLFRADAKKRITELNLIQDGIKPVGTASRMAGQSADAAIAQMRVIDQRYQTQKPDPRSATELKRLMEGLAEGKPDYDRLSASVAEDVRSNLLLLRPLFSNFGSVVSMRFEHVDPTGIDTYHIVFEHGEADMDILLRADEGVQWVKYFPD